MGATDKDEGYESGEDVAALEVPQDMPDDPPPPPPESSIMGGLFESDKVKEESVTVKVRTEIVN